MIASRRLTDFWGVTWLLISVLAFIERWALVLLLSKAFFFPSIKLWLRLLAEEKVSLFLKEFTSHLSFWQDDESRGHRSCTNAAAHWRILGCLSLSRLQVTSRFSLIFHAIRYFRRTGESPCPVCVPLVFLCSRVSRRIGAWLHDCKCKPQNPCTINLFSTNSSWAWSGLNRPHLNHQS